MPKIDTFQDLIRTLQDFWAEKGCVLMQPYDIEVGAWTFHPATFLRAIGPEQWSAAYPQPCRRPTDGRYGENPNRYQYYYQFQVVMKPHPDNFQALYLESLAHVGIDPTIHDIRFVEDNWESPTLGAWGLGWEVWMDGMEITQFTYFQQVAGIECFPVMGEITYGLERLALYLQGLPLLLIRSNMLEVMQEDFVTMSKMKGLSSWRIVIYHAARNALLPVATAFTLGVGFAFGGNVVIETVFSWPGLGRLLVFAVSSSDYPLAQGAFIFLTAILILMNFLADLMYLFLDPRVSYKTKN